MKHLKCSRIVRESRDNDIDYNRPGTRDGRATEERRMNQRAKRLSRRNFLLTVGAGGVVTAAAVVATKNTASSEVSSKDKRSTRGYQSSEHVNNYYRTTKV
jgi:hypothetical protein